MNRRGGVTNPVPPPNPKGRGTTRLERRQRDDLNRYRKLTIGQDRIWTLQRIAMFAEADADIEKRRDVEALGVTFRFDVEGAKSDALFLRRLAWDLEAQHDAVHGRRPSLDPQGSRP